MNTPASNFGSRGANSGGNPNLVFVFSALVVILVGLGFFIYAKKEEGTLLKNLPEAVKAESDNPVDGGSATSIGQNPEGEALLKEVTSKPLDAAPEPEKKAEQVVTDSASVQPESLAKETDPKPQFFGTRSFNYTVKASETLFRIASKFKTPATQIRKENNLSDEDLQTDQELKLMIQGIHTAGQGEGLSAIARTYGVSVAEIRKANELTTDVLKEGDELIIPIK
jgi:LysM repeat protein